MKVLLLGPPNLELVNFLKGCGDSCVNTSEKIYAELIILEKIDFIVSYGYRYIINDSILKMFPDKAINIHISLLPWNRGADPNLWSFLENTPKGVTIHYLDFGIDTGNILIQKEVVFPQHETLRTSYEKLSEVALDLFKEHWMDIRAQNLDSHAQTLAGSYHRVKDKSKYEYLLTQGWDTPVAQLIGKALV